MKCMKRVAFESDEELDWITVKGNHIPIKKGQDKGDAIADFFDKKSKEKEFKSGGVYKDKEIDPEDLDEDSDFKKNEVISDEDYEKLDVGSEYIEYSRNIAGYIRPNDEGYNLGKTLTIKVKNEYSDDPDQYVKELIYYYDDDGKHVTTMTVETTDSERDAEYISSEKRLNEDGEFEEIEYTDEEHYKNLKRFTQSYSERGNERERWDKLQKQALKIKNNSSKRDEFRNKEKELEESLLELKMEDGEEKEKIKKEIELSNLQNDEKYDDVNKLSFNDYYSMKSYMGLQHKVRNKDDLPFEEMDDYVKDLDDTKKPIFEKFKRVRNKLKKDIEDGNIKSNIKDMDKTSENFTISYQNNVVMNNLLVDRQEKEVGMIDINKKMYEMLDQTNEKYYEDAGDNDTVGSFYLNVINHIEDKAELDKDKMKQFEDELAELKWGTQEYANKLAEQMEYEDSVKKSLTDRDRKMLESHKEMTRANKYSKEDIVSLKDDVKFFKSRNENEYVTPLVEKNIHVYGFPDKKKKVDKNELDKWKKIKDNAMADTTITKKDLDLIDSKIDELSSDGSVSDVVMEHAYNTLKETYTKNSWVNVDIKNRVRTPNYTGSSKIPSNSRNLEIERKMHYQLHAGQGRKFKVSGTSYTTGGNWDKSNQSINIFNSTKRSIDWAHNHEMAHSFFDYTLDALDEGGLKSKKKSMETWKNQCENIDEGVVRDILGKYAGDYLRDYKNNPQNESYRNLLHTEMYSAIKDLKDGKEKGDGNYDPEEGYEKLSKKYPELVKSYEILTGKEEGNLYYESLKIMSNESVTMNSLDEIIRIQYLDKNGKAVDKKDADIVIIKKYDKNGRMVSHQSLFRDDIANESDDDVEWITVKGNHIPIKKGQDKGDAIVDFFDKKNKEKKDVKFEPYKKEIEKDLEPTKEVQDLQKNVDDRVREKIENVIKSKTDKVLKVETQGSYVKGTDLPSSGSDMDIFVVFKSDTPEKDMQQLGLEIGLETMTKEFAESQGWENFRVFTKDANSKYAEAYFDVDGQNIEVQIVPTRDLTLDQIKNKELNGEKISIGMERTPHQTKFMNDNLTKEQKKDVRMLKKLMKETGLYDSSVKSQGFSGYSAEALVHYLGSFDKIIDYFASDFKVGGVIGLPNGKKESDYHKITDQSNSSWRPFHIIDPIDPNRDLTTAFSPKKIARTILTSKSLKETGEPPKKTKPISLKGVGLNFKSDIDDENTLNGQIQSLEKDMIAKLNRIGFRNIKEFDKPKKIVEGFEINPDRTSIEQGEENEKNDYTLNIAFENYYLDTDETVSVKDISNMKEQAKDNMFDGMKKAGTKYVVSDDETTVSIYGKKKYTSIEDTVNGFLEGETIEGQKLSNSNLLKEIQKQQVKSVKNQSYYDNLI